MMSLQQQKLDTNSDKTSQAELREQVRQFWNDHIHDWKIAKSDVGTKEFFEEIEDYRFEKLHYLPKLVNFESFSDKHVLDVGCGVGNDLSRFSRSGAKVVGIDLAEHSIDLARKNFNLRALEGEFFVMDGEDMSFPDNSFDVVYCHTVIHFTVDPDRMIAEIFRVLKPGGTAILMTVNRHSWLNFLHKLMNVQIDHLDAPVFHKFTRQEFQSLIGLFQDVEVIPERFPVPTKVHGGIKAFLYNAVFVGLFNMIPRYLTRNSGHHLLAFAYKSATPNS